MKSVKCVTPAYAISDKLKESFFILWLYRENMDKKKEEKKELDIEVDENDDSILDGKGLHDFYRHTTKLIK